MAIEGHADRHERDARDPREEGGHALDDIDRELEETREEAVEGEHEPHGGRPAKQEERLSGVDEGIVRDPPTSKVPGLEAEEELQEEVEGSVLLPCSRWGPDAEAGREQRRGEHKKDAPEQDPAKLHSRDATKGPALACA